MKNNLESKLGKNSRVFRNIMKGAKKVSEKEREVVKKKNNTKIKHLKNKYEPMKPETARCLEKYIDAAIISGKDISKYAKGKVLVFGDVQISEEEKELLSLCPKYAIFNDLKEEEFAVEMEICFTKYRWDEGGKEEEDIKLTPEEEELYSLIEAEARQTQDPLKKVVDMTKQRCTDVKHNSRVILPGGLKCHKEAMVEMKRVELNRSWQDYFQQQTDEKGRQTPNLLPVQRKGLISLQRRIKMVRSLSV